MNRRTLATLLGLGGWVAVGACSSNASNPPGAGPVPVFDGGGESSETGSSSGSSGGSSGSSGSSGGQGDDGSMTGDAGTTGPSDAAVADVQITPPSDSSMPEPTCSPLQTWGAATNVPGVPSFSTQPLVTITNDELTLAWVTDNGDGTGSVFVADRTSTSVGFGSPSQLVAMPLGGSYLVDGATVSDAGDAYFAFDRVALSSDGLTLIGVGVGGLKMAQFIRASRTDPFVVTPMENRYTTLAATLMTGEKLGDPVLAANGADLVYSKYGNSPSLTIYESLLTAGQTWPAGAGEGTMALAEDAGRRKRPTAMSGDRLTLFVWDEAGEAYGVIRPTETSDFIYAIPFGDRFSIQVNGACSRIYSIAPAASGFALVQADAM
jgi:hypothetical protein